MVSKRTYNFRRRSYHVSRDQDIEDYIIPDNNEKIMSNIINLIFNNYLKYYLE